MRLADRARVLADLLAPDRVHDGLIALADGLGVDGHRCGSLQRSGSSADARRQSTPMPARSGLVGPRRCLNDESRPWDASTRWAAAGCASPTAARGGARTQRTLSRNSRSTSLTRSIGTDRRPLEGEVLPSAGADELALRHHRRPPALARRLADGLSRNWTVSATMLTAWRRLLGGLPLAPLEAVRRPRRDCPCACSARRSRPRLRRP